MNSLNRRNFLKSGTVALAGSGLVGSSSYAGRSAEIKCAKPGNPLPRWRGFNLLGFFSHTHSDEDHRNLSVSRQDLKWIRDWGFDYIRIPFSYWLLVDGDWKKTGKMNPDEIRNLDEKALTKLDDFVEACREFGLHVTLNMHRAPGYCINGWNTEPFNLFKDPEAEEHFVFYWKMLAKRYEGISSKELSFNLVNEAPGTGEKMSREDYRRVMVNGMDAIREISPDRIIIIDGTAVGSEVVDTMIHENVAQAFHAYDPHRLTHYKATWVGDNADWPVPQYPYQQDNGVLVDKRYLAVRMAPWAELARRGVGVHCGEFGCFNHTPHKVFLDWITDVLDLLKENDIGYALWNFRGAFGLMDSNRGDVEYEDWYGHKLDRKLLDLMLK